MVPGAPWYHDTMSPVCLLLHLSQWSMCQAVLGHLTTVLDTLSLVFVVFVIELINLSWKTSLLVIILIRIFFWSLVVCFTVLLAFVLILTSWLFEKSSLVATIKIITLYWNILLSWCIFGRKSIVQLFLVEHLSTETQAATTNCVN